MKLSRRGLFSGLIGLGVFLGLPISVAAEPRTLHFDQDDYEVTFVGDAHVEYTKMLIDLMHDTNADRILVSPTILTVLQSGAHVAGFERLDYVAGRGPEDDDLRSRYIGHIRDGEQRTPLHIDVYLNDSAPTVLTRKGVVVARITHSTRSLRFI